MWKGTKNELSICEFVYNNRSSANFNWRWFIGWSIIQEEGEDCAVTKETQGQQTTSEDITRLICISEVASCFEPLLTEGVERSPGFSNGSVVIIPKEKKGAIFQSEFSV
jgi:hypothetical protein